MLIIRLSYSSMLPSVSELISSAVLQNSVASPANLSLATSSSQAEAGHDAGQERKSPSNQAENHVASAHKVDSFQAVLDIAYQQDEVALYHHLYHNVRVVEFQDLTIKINPINSAPHDIHLQLKNFLDKITGQRWNVINVPKANGVSSENERQKHLEEKAKHAAVGHSLVQEVLSTFEGMEVGEVVKIGV